MCLALGGGMEREDPDKHEHEHAPHKPTVKPSPRSQEQEQEHDGKEQAAAAAYKAEKKQRLNEHIERRGAAGRSDPCCCSPPPPDHHSHSNYVHQTKRGRKKRKLNAVVAESTAAAAKDVCGAVGRKVGGRSLRVSSGSSESLDRDNKKEKQTQSHEATEPVSGKLTEQQTATPIPDRKLLELVLDKLQKKDKYDVFAEPVDPDEVPDYYDFIKNPMDFSTVRNKLARGVYDSLKKFEKDVILICSNAMSYNASSTIYYRHVKARAIQELAKRYFQMLRLNPEKVELEHKSPSNTKSSYAAKKFATSVPSGKLGHESTGLDLPSGATPPSYGNLLYNSLLDSVKLKKSDAYERSGTRYENSNGTGYQGHNSTDGINSAVDSKAEQSEVFSALALKVRAMKDGRRAPFWEEERRDTYRPRIANGDESIFALLCGETKQLIPVGIQPECTYVKSLTRFSAELGPVAWKIAAAKIKRACSPLVASFPHHNSDLKSTVDLLSIEKNKAQPKAVSSVALHINKGEIRFNNNLATQLDGNNGFVKNGTSECQSNQLTSTKCITPVYSATNSNAYWPSAKFSSISNPHSFKLISVPEPTAEIPFEGTKHIDKKSGDLITPSTKFTSEVSQSRLLEIVSRNNRLMQWMPTKQADGGQPLTSFQVSDSESIYIDRGCPRKTFDTSKLCTSSGSVDVAVTTRKKSIHDYQDRSIAVCAAQHASENFTAKGLNYLANSDKSKMFLPLQQTSPNVSVSAPQSSISSTGPIVIQELNAMQACVRAQNADMVHVDPGSRLTNGAIQVASSTHFNSQQNEPQVRSSSTVSQFMQHQMLLDMSCYLQSQLSWMNPPNSAILGHVTSDRNAGKILESHVSNRMVTLSSVKSLVGNESPQPHLHPLKVVCSQEHLQTISDLSHSVPSDIGNGLMRPMSPDRQSSEMLVHSQQPDLVLPL